MKFITEFLGVSKQRFDPIYSSLDQILSLNLNTLMNSEVTLQLYSVRYLSIKRDKQLIMQKFPEIGTEINSTKQK